VRRLSPLASDAHTKIERAVHLDAFRHAHAGELGAEGVPVNVIQQQIGYGSLAPADPLPSPYPSRERHKALASVATNTKRWISRE